MILAEARAATLTEDLVAAVVVLACIAVPALAPNLPAAELARRCDWPRACIACTPPVSGPVSALLRPDRRPLPHTASCDPAGQGLRGGAALLFGQRLDLNQASAAELDAVPGLSSSLAEAIVDERTRLGGFDRLDQLTAVSGIGPKTLERLRVYLRVDDDAVLDRSGKSTELTYPPSPHIR